MDLPLVDDDVNATFDALWDTKQISLRVLDILSEDEEDEDDP